MRDAIVIHRSFYKKVKNSPSDECLEAILAFFEYGFNGVELECWSCLANESLELARQQFGASRVKNALQTTECQQTLTEAGGKDG